MTTGARIVLVLFVVCVLVGAATGVTLYYRLAYVWGFLLGGSWLWSWISLRGCGLFADLFHARPNGPDLRRTL
jgi:hypothetical protein